MGREAKLNRKTSETDVSVRIKLDGEGNYSIDTGILFLDHMLSAMAFHGNMDVDINASGDIGVDAHHTVEDVAITLGSVIDKALGNRESIERYGYSTIPMDDSCA